MNVKNLHWWFSELPILRINEWQQKRSLGPFPTEWIPSILHNFIHFRFAWGSHYCLGSLCLRLVAVQEGCLGTECQLSQLMSRNILVFTLYLLVSFFARFHRGSIDVMMFDIFWYILIYFDMFSSCLIFVQTCICTFFVSLIGACYVFYFYYLKLSYPTHQLGRSHSGHLRAPAESFSNSEPSGTSVPAAFIFSMKETLHLENATKEGYILRIDTKHAS